MLVDTRRQARRLSSPRQGTPEKPTASQLLTWAGIDFNLWAVPTRMVKAEALDERMVRRTYLNDAGVLAYRHYELWTDATPDFRIALAPRASIDNGTLIIRKALAGGRIGFDIHGGGGYDNIQDHVARPRRGRVRGGPVLVARACRLATTWPTKPRPGCPVRCRLDG